MTVIEQPTPKGNPCINNPCGPYSQCRAIGDTPACSCLPDYIGRAPNCRPECMISAECPSNLACINERCKDPCIGACGINTKCTVINHNSICHCDHGYTGDPFHSCTQISTRKALLLIPHIDLFRRFSLILTELNKKKKKHCPIPCCLVPSKPEPVPSPCANSPCGANAVCKERDGVGSCACLPEYFGDPYTGCRPECVQNSECDYSRACINNKCQDPCQGVCPVNASKSAIHNVISITLAEAQICIHVIFSSFFSLYCSKSCTELLL